MRARFARRKKGIYKYLVKRKGEKCAKCGVEGKMTIDHIQRITDGGDNDYKNFQLLCPPCHRAKDKMEKIGAGKRHRKRAKRAALGHWQPGNGPPAVLRSEDDES